MILEVLPLRFHPDVSNEWNTPMDFQSIALLHSDPNTTWTDPGIRFLEGNDAA